MDRPSESSSRVACCSFVRRPSKPSPRRLGETCVNTSLDGRLTEIWVVLAHHSAFACSPPVRREGVDDSRESATVAVAWTERCGARRREAISLQLSAPRRALCKEKAAWEAAREDEVR